MRAVLRFLQHRPHHVIGRGLVFLGLLLHLPPRQWRRTYLQAVWWYAGIMSEVIAGFAFSPLLVRIGMDGALETLRRMHDAVKEDEQAQKGQPS